MDDFFSNSNAHYQYAHAYSAGFNASDSGSGGTSAGSTPPMGADFSSFDAGAAWAGNANAYQPRVGFDGSGHHAPLGTLNAYGGPDQQQPRVAPPPPSAFDFDPEDPFGDLFEDMERPLNARNAAQMQVYGPPPPAYQAQYPYNPSAFDNGFGAGSYGPPATSMGYPGLAPHAASYFTPPAASFSMQQPVDVQHGTPATNMGYAGFAPPAAFPPPAPAANSNTQNVQRYDLHSVGVVLPGAGEGEPQGIESPPPRGRKGNAGKSRARAGRARKHKASSPAPASPIAGPSRVYDDGEYVAQGRRDLDAQNGVLPSFLALQNADVGIPHAPLAPSEEGAYPGGDVQDNTNNRITRGQSQGASASGPPAFRAARTAPGVRKDAPRDTQDRLQIHAPVANPKPPIKGKAVPVFEPAPLGKTEYCRECWEAGDVVYWQDDAGMKKHRRDKQHGATRVPHQCIFECGFFKCSTRAEHFIRHRNATGGTAYCKPYHELEAKGGVKRFLIKRGLQGHWQLGRAKPKAKKGGRRQVVEEDEDTDAAVDEDDDE
ncbi:hypothetical protein EXIGLDRAFT_755219 [Exidia glandulosa HHB12029]|uniref:Uncharacterized protein n=1 Tax=Exidia glandulosa HHB12029 TaxID=1314781 RepID=A0A165C8M0_EXIGL|nr:hypothetical protein EXIGLDRAFT_755219 [Exidia glandulosa HHB12029]